MTENLFPRSIAHSNTGMGLENELYTLLILNFNLVRLLQLTAPQTYGQNRKNKINTMPNNRSCLFQLTDIMAPSNDLKNLELRSENGSKFNITTCNSLRCTFNAVSSVKKRISYCIVPTRIISVNRH